MCGLLLQGNFKSIADVEANLTAIKIASLSGLKKGTKVRRRTLVYGYTHRVDNNNAYLSVRVHTGLTTTHLSVRVHTGLTTTTHRVDPALKPELGFFFQTILERAQVNHTPALKAAALGFPSTTSFEKIKYTV